MHRVVEHDGVLAHEVVDVAVAAGEGDAVADDAIQPKNAGRESGQALSVVRVIGE
ncbi:MAG TPA: hypothetical protein VN897_15100 [Mycobacterium sp.]|nr:hypothetical protein [Mycobacterium sp.]